MARTSFRIFSYALLFMPPPDAGTEKGTIILLTLPLEQRPFRPRIIRLVPTLRVGTPGLRRSASRPRAYLSLGPRFRDAERPGKDVPTRSVGTRRNFAPETVFNGRPAKCRSAATIQK